MGLGFVAGGGAQSLVKVKALRPRDQGGSRGNGAEVTFGLRAPACGLELATEPRSQPSGDGYALSFVFLAPAETSPDRDTSESSFTLETCDITRRLMARPLQRDWKCPRMSALTRPGSGTPCIRPRGERQGITVFPQCRNRFFFNKLPGSPCPNWMARVPFTLRSDATSSNPL